MYVAVLHLHDQSHYIKELSSKIQPSAVVRDLGLHLDTELSMKHHVVKVAVIYYYHLPDSDASVRFDDALDSTPL